MIEKITRPRSDDEKEKLFQRLVSLWKHMRFDPVYNMDGELIGGETVIVEEVKNLADSSQDQIPPEV